MAEYWASLPKVEKGFGMYSCVNNFCIATSDKSSNENIYNLMVSNAKSSTKCSIVKLSIRNISFQVTLVRATKAHNVSLFRHIKNSYIFSLGFDSFAFIPHLRQ